MTRAIDLQFGVLGRPISGCAFAPTMDHAEHTRHESRRRNDTVDVRVEARALSERLCRLA